MGRNVITWLDMTKKSGRYCIPVVVIKNCKSGLSYILAVLFHKCLNESNRSTGSKVLPLFPVFKNVSERSLFENSQTN